MAVHSMDTGAGQRGLSDQARAATEQAKQRAAESFGRQKTSVTHDMRDVARALRTTAEQCEGQQQSFIAGYARRAADGVERLGDVLEQKDLREMVRDLEQICRERPLVVGGAAMLAGFLGTRLARTAVSARRDAPQGEREDKGPTGPDEEREQVDIEFESTQLEGGV